MTDMTNFARGHVLRGALLSAASLAVVTAWSGSALAQGANVNNNNSAVTIDDDQGPGNVIIVTAQLREQNVQDIPLVDHRGQRATARGAQPDQPDRDHRRRRPTCCCSRTRRARAIRCAPSSAASASRDQSPSVEPGVGIYIDDIYFGTVTASRVRPGRPRPHRSAARAAGHAGGHELAGRRHQAVLAQAGGRGRLRRGHGGQSRPPRRRRPAPTSPSFPMRCSRASQACTATMTAT